MAKNRFRGYDDEDLYYESDYRHQRGNDKKRRRREERLRAEHRRDDCDDDYAVGY